MEAIAQHSLTRASEEAAKLWAFASAQYPKQQSLILNLVTVAIIEAISAFALNARRALEMLPPAQKFPLTQPRCEWVPHPEGEIVGDLWDGLNRVIHAQRLEVGFEQLPERVSAIEGGALVIPYVRASTDQRKLAFIDPFALSHAYLYHAFPRLVGSDRRDSTLSVH